MRHLAHWDQQGKEWVKKEARANNIQGIVHGLCNHHKGTGERPCFANLTDAQINEVARECCKDNFIKETIQRELGPL